MNKMKTLIKVYDDKEYLNNVMIPLSLSFDMVVFIYREEIKDKLKKATIDLLNKYNISSLILDVDNTLCLKKGKIILDGVKNWLSEMKKAGIKLIILSNAKKSRMNGIAKGFELPFVALGLKPLTVGFKRAAKRMGEKSKKITICFIHVV